MRAALASLWKPAGPLSSRTEMSPFLMHVPVGGLSGIHLRLPVDLGKTSAASRRSSLHKRKYEG